MRCKFVNEGIEEQEGQGNKGERIGMGYAHENRTSAVDAEIRR
ncbi:MULTISPECIES: hypothetical protein [Bacillaceae]|nr:MULTISPECIES: hypothetical protein [Bacillaceae]